MNYPIVFADKHHTGLAESLRLLVEVRLKGTLLFPIGEEWATEGYWLIHKPYNYAKSTVKQFLSLDQEYKHPDGTPPMNKITGGNSEYYEVFDEHHQQINKHVTLEQFKQLPVDIVIASIPDHVEPYKRLIKNFHPEAKFVFQMGNMFNEILSNLHEIPNLLSSTIDFKVPPTCNAVFYHQEFSLDIFKPTGIKPEKKITSFIIDLPKTGHGNMFYTMKSIMPEYEFKSYGAGCDNGVVTGVQNIANIMNSSYFGFHAKYGGDGFGHLLYNWFACGKPIITCFRDYSDKLGAELLTDMETCIDLNQHSVENTCEIIRNLTPEKYSYMSQQCYNRFKEKVDYNKEEQEIRVFLSKLR